jgi:hypothetical protein
MKLDTRFTAVAFQSLGFPKTILPMHNTLKMDDILCWSENTNYHYKLLSMESQSQSG